MNRDNTTLLQESRDRWKERAKYLEKVSIGLATALILLLIVTIVLAVTHRPLNEEEKSADTQTTKPISIVVTEAQAIAPTQKQPVKKYIGDYTITYYCSCRECSGKWGNQTSTGVLAQEGITIAVDPNEIPYGTKVYIEGVGYRIAQDCGGAIKGNKIDVYMDSHQEALQNGIHEAKVYTMTTGGNNNG